MYEVFMHDGRASAVPSDQEDEDLRVDISQIAPDRRRAWGRGGAGDVARAACPATVTCRGPANRRSAARPGSTPVWPPPPPAGLAPPPPRGGAARGRRERNEQRNPCSRRDTPAV